MICSQSPWLLPRRHVLIYSFYCNSDARESCIIGGEQTNRLINSHYSFLFQDLSSSARSLPLPPSLVKPHSDGWTTEWPELGLVFLRGRKDEGLGSGAQGLQCLHQLPHAWQILFFFFFDKVSLTLSAQRQRGLWHSTWPLAWMTLHPTGALRNTPVIPANC